MKLPEVIYTTLGVGFGFAIGSHFAPFEIYQDPSTPTEIAADQNAHQGFEELKNSQIFVSGALINREVLLEIKGVEYFFGESESHLFNTGPNGNCGEQFCTYPDLENTRYSEVPNAARIKKQYDNPITMSIGAVFGGFGGRQFWRIVFAKNGIEPERQKLTGKKK